MDEGQRLYYYSRLEEFLKGQKPAKDKNLLINHHGRSIFSNTI